MNSERLGFASWLWENSSNVTASEKLSQHPLHPCLLHTRKSPLLLLLHPCLFLGLVGTRQGKGATLFNLLCSEPHTAPGMCIECDKSIWVSPLRRKIHVFWVCICALFSLSECWKHQRRAAACGFNPSVQCAMEHQAACSYLTGGWLALPRSKCQKAKRMAGISLRKGIGSVWWSE